MCGGEISQWTQRKTRFCRGGKIIVTSCFPMQYESKQDDYYNSMQYTQSVSAHSYKLLSDKVFFIIPLKGKKGRQKKPNRKNIFVEYDDS